MWIKQLVSKQCNFRALCMRICVVVRIDEVMPGKFAFAGHCMYHVV
jgi:hypothetical protein